MTAREKVAEDEVVCFIDEKGVMNVERCNKDSLGLGMHELDYICNLFYSLKKSDPSITLITRKRKELWPTQ